MKKQRLLFFALFCTLFAPVLAYSQVTVAPFLTSEVQLMNNNGAPLAGGCIFFFAAGTSTPQPTFTDSTGTVQAANPVVLDSAGRAAIWMSALAYKIQVKTSGGVNCASGAQLWVQDNVTWQTPLTAQANLSITGNFNVTQPTAATSSVNQSSFTDCLHGTYWNGSASTDDKWCWQDVLPNGTNPTSTLTLQHTGSSGVSTLSLPTIQSVTANNPNAGANDVTLGILDRTRWNCGNGSGYRFTTIESALADITANSTQGGYIWTCPDNTTDTTPGQVEIGSATKTAVVQLHPGNQWLDNTATVHTYSWGLHNASALVGSNNGHIGGSRTGGAYLKYGCLANTSYGLTTVEGIAPPQTFGQAFGMFSHIMMEGCPTGTVGAGSPSIAMLNIEGISSMNQWDNAEIFNFANTVGIRVASNNTSGFNSVVGPLVLTNLWSDGGYNTGAQPWKITATAGSCAGVLPLAIIGGVANHPGTGGTLFEANGQACPQPFFGGVINGFYTENQQNGNSIHFKIVDASNVNVAGVASAMQNTDTQFDFSQGAAGRTCNWTMQNVRNNNGTTINNHISGFNSGTNKQYLSFYHFGGDTTCNVYPLVIDWNTLKIRPNSPLVGLLVSNGVDAINNAIDIDSGLTAANQSVFRYLDRGTVEWQHYKSGTQDWILRDMINSKNRIDFPQSATAAGTGTINFANTEHIAWRDAGNAGDHLLGEVQHSRGTAGCATGASVGAACTTVVTWPSAFADANYTVTCSGTAITSGVPVNGGITAQIAASVTFQTVAATASAAQYTNINCIGIHD